VVGRFSLWSNFGLALVGSLGLDIYSKLLSGAHEMDKHFLSTELKENLPYILGLTRVWNRNILGFTNLGIIPYGENLKFFHTWVQQLEMESNGKSVDTDGKRLNYQTAPVVFGAVGTDAQHSFFQTLHQGSEPIPIEILVALNSSLSEKQHGSQKIENFGLVINALAQAESLLNGFIGNKEEFRNLKGGRPSTLISWDKTNALSLGRLLSLYENASIVTGLIWGINSFDQFGVELGKKIAKKISNGEGLSDLSVAARNFFDNKGLN
jgi:glucose-6-phosphate isomerase